MKPTLAQPSGGSWFGGWRHGPALTLLVALVAPVPAAIAQTLVSADSTVTANPHDPLEVELISGSVCYLVTFEGGAHLNQIHLETGGLVPGTPIRFGPEWVTLTSGTYSNNPSIPTIATYLATAGNVTFDQPVARVSFFYASLDPVILEAFDAGGSLLASALGPVNSQPDGWTLWEQLGVDVGSDTITSVRLSSGYAGTGVDDFQACSVSQSLVEVEIDLHPQNYPNAVDPYTANSNKPIDLGIFSTSDFDALTIDVSSAVLGDPALSATVAAQGAWAQDLNGDGLLDLVINFGEARELGTVGALDSSSTEVELVAFTIDGDVVCGLDTIVITGR